jgi:hypothetical protein
MDPITFRPLGEVAAFVREKTDFLLALNQWATRSPDEFSRVAPPVGALRMEDSDENAILASVFRQIALAGFPTRRMVLLQTAIAVHQRRYEIAWNYVPSSANPHAVASREGRVALAPYRAMIDRLRDWNEAIFDQAMGSEP